MDILRQGSGCGLHIWYPVMKLVTIDCTLLQKHCRTQISIKQYGYLYDIHAALSGKSSYPENCYDSLKEHRHSSGRDGTSRLCAEYFSLVGNSTKDADGNSLKTERRSFL